MGFLTRLFAETPARPGPIDDYWYEPYSRLDGTVRPTTETALTVSTVYRGVSVLANTLAMLPLPVLERLPNDGGKDKARSHRLYRTLHDRPNKWQTSFHWRRMGMVHMVLQGNFYNRILNPRGFGTELVPLDPRRTSVVDQRGDGALIYEHLLQNGDREHLIGGEEVLHIPGLGFDGKEGYSVIHLMRRALEGAVNTESFASRLFSKAPLMRGFLQSPKKFEPDSRKQLEESFARANSGPEGWHRAVLLEQGMEWKAGGMMSANDSQFIQTREHSIPEFARFIGVPTVLLMHADKTALYANAEQFFQSFLNFDIAHWFVNWEQTINQTLFLESEQDRFFSEFNRDGMLRGDAKTRGDFYRVMIELGVFTPNEVRKLEGKNALDGLDEPRPSKQLQSAGGDAAVALSPQVNAIVSAAAARLIRKECAAVTKAAKTHDTNPVARLADIAKFYDRFQHEVAATLALSSITAAAYCAEQQAQFIAGGIAAVSAWESMAHRSLLANLALVSDPMAQCQRQIRTMSEQVQTLAARQQRPRRTSFERDSRSGLVTALIDHDDDDGETPTIQ